MRLLNGLGLVLVACGASGCGADFGTPVAVSGKITDGSEAVGSANVSFYALNKELPAEHRTRNAVTDAQGSYSLSDVYPGEYQVMISKSQSAEEIAMAPAEPSAGTDPFAKFGPESPLRATVSADTTTFNFDLSTAR